VDARGFVEAKLAERDQRHKKVGDSRYMVEPNIKDGKGGMRDLQTLDGSPGRYTGSVTSRQWCRWGYCA